MAVQDLHHNEAVNMIVNSYNIYWTLGKLDKFLKCKSLKSEIFKIGQGTMLESEWDFHIRPQNQRSQEIPNRFELDVTFRFKKCTSFSLEMYILTEIGKNNFKILGIYERKDHKLPILCEWHANLPEREYTATFVCKVFPPEIPYFVENVNIITPCHYNVEDVREFCNYFKSLNISIESDRQLLCDKKASTYLASWCTIFQSPNVESIAEKLDFEGSTRLFLFKYLCTRDCDILSKKEAGKLLNAVNVYQLPNMKDICLSYLIRHISLECMPVILKNSKEYTEEQLQKKIEWEIRTVPILCNKNPEMPRLLFLELPKHLKIDFRNIMDITL